MDSKEITLDSKCGMYVMNINICLIDFKNMILDFYLLCA